MSKKNSSLVGNICYVPELSNDLLHLLDHPYNHFSDAVLKCGGIEIPVHKCILSVRSSVFAAMFRSQMKEGQSGYVDIVDIELGVLRVMLRYLYSGQINSLTDTMTEDLLFAADKYGLKDLKRICIDKLKLILSADNVSDILILGELLDIHLKEHAKEFIFKCKFSDLEVTEGWKSLLAGYPKLAMEVMRSIVIYEQDSSHQNEIQKHIYEITVRYIDKIISVNVSAKDTIKTVKEKLQSTEGIPPHQQRLFFKSRLLQDDITISDYDIYKSSTLNLIRSMEIFVRTNHGILTLYIENARSCTIKDVKVKIHGKHPGIRPERQRLVYVSKNLEDERTLSDYSITNYTTLELFGKFKNTSNRISPQCQN